MKRLKSTFRNIRGSYKMIWSLPLTNIKWHFEVWLVAVTSNRSDLTLISWPSYQFRSSHYRQKFHAISEAVVCEQGTFKPRLNHRYLVPSLFGGIPYTLIVTTNFLLPAVMFQTFHFEHPSALSQMYLKLDLYDINNLQINYR